MIILSTVLGLLFYGFGIDSTFSDSTFGLLFVGASLPGMMGFIIIIVFGVQSSWRKDLLQGHICIKQLLQKLIGTHLYAR